MLHLPRLAHGSLLADSQTIHRSLNCHVDHSRSQQNAHLGRLKPMFVLERPDRMIVGEVKASQTGENLPLKHFLS
jgi:hypothetical protein